MVMVMVMVMVMLLMMMMMLMMSLHDQDDEDLALDACLRYCGYETQPGAVVDLFAVTSTHRQRMWEFCNLEERLVERELTPYI
eukprot:10191848-Karenia_brevis.AAC.1